MQVEGVPDRQELAHTRRDEIAQIIGRETMAPMTYCNNAADAVLAAHEDRTLPSPPYGLIAEAASFIRDHWGIAGDGTNQDPDTETAAALCTALDRAAASEHTPLSPSMREKLRLAADIVGKAYDGGLDLAHDLREMAAASEHTPTPPERDEVREEIAQTLAPYTADEDGDVDWCDDAAAAVVVSLDERGWLREHTPTPTRPDEAFDAWCAQRGVKGDPLLETIARTAFSAGFDAAADSLRVSPSTDTPTPPDADDVFGERPESEFYVFSYGHSHPTGGWSLLTSTEDPGDFPRECLFPLYRRRNSLRVSDPPPGDATK